MTHSFQENNQKGSTLGVAKKYQNIRENGQTKPWKIKLYLYSRRNRQNW